VSKDQRSKRSHGRSAGKLGKKEVGEELLYQEDINQQLENLQKTNALSRTKARGGGGGGGDVQGRGTRPAV